MENLHIPRNKLKELEYMNLKRGQVLILAQ